MFKPAGTWGIFVLGTQKRLMALIVVLGWVFGAAPKSAERTAERCSECEERVGKKFS
jgi:hypothetical protein